jgi:hypothetical protein
VIRVPSRTSRPSTCLSVPIYGELSRSQIASSRICLWRPSEFGDFAGVRREQSSTTLDDCSHQSAYTTGSVGLRAPRVT